MGEQASSDSESSAVGNLLVPGLGTYDKYKRLGASRNLIEDAEKSAAFKQGVADKPAQARPGLAKLVPGTPKLLAPLPPVAKKPITAKKPTPAV